MSGDKAYNQRYDPQDTAYGKSASLAKMGNEDGQDLGKGLQDSHGLTSEEVAVSRRQYGSNEVKAQQTPEWKKIAKRYTDWVVILMLVAAVISIAVKNDGDRGYTSFVLLILELNLVVWVGYYSDRNAGNAVKELEELSAPSAMCRRDDNWTDIRVSDLVVGDLIQLKGGDVIPADAKLVGNSEPVKVDEASLTGESLAVNKQTGDTILSGAVIEQGESEAVVTAVGGNTFFGKTITLLSRPEEKGHLQKILGLVQITIGILSFAGVLVILIVNLTRGEGAEYSIVIFFVLLICCIPVGMPVVTTTVLAIGAREMANEKALVNRLSALEELSGVEILASDKTGTLTLNKLSLDKAAVVATKGVSTEQVLLMAALSARWENADAIDTALTSAVEDPDSRHQYKINRLIPFSPVDKRTTAYCTGPDGKDFVTTKGAPQIVAQLLEEGEAQQTLAYIDEQASRGLRALAVANSADEGKTWSLYGLISLLDPPREDSADTIKEAQSLGVEVKMITGDNIQIGVETAKRLGMGTNFMEGKELMRADISKEELGARAAEFDGFAGVYPEHKFALVQAMQAKGMLIGMTGDGVNDAPALKAANVGIAVAGATPAAQGAADIILTEEGISTIITAINRSRKIFRRIEAYIIYRTSCSMTILLFFFFATICLKFVMPTWVLILLSLTGDLSCMAVSLDKVHTSDLPLLFDITKCLAIALTMSVISAGGTLLLLGLASLDRINWWHIWNITVRPDLSPENITDGQVVAVIYIALTIITQLSIISIRNPSFWWHFSKKTAPTPSWKLALPVTLFLVGSTFIAVYWPTRIKPDGGRGFMDGSGWATIMLTWFYTLWWFTIADAAKTLIQWVFRKTTEAELATKEHGTKLPGWARVVTAPGRLSEQLINKMRVRFTKETKEDKEAPLPQVEAVTKSAEGETVLSFSQQSAGSQTKGNSKSFRSSNLSRGSSHLAA